jgi:hypothetical protein
MPTAAKLVAAALFAVLAVVAAEVFRPLLPEGTQTGWLLPSCAAIGLICGWRIMGRLVGKGYSAAMSSGMRTSVTVLFWATLAFSIYTMIYRSTKMLYDDAGEAVLAVFDLMLGYGKLMLDAPFIAVVLVGGLICGALTEYAGRRWS